MEFEGATYFCVQVSDAWLLVQNAALPLCPKCPFPVQANVCCFALERDDCCWWRCLIFPSCFFSCGHCDTKLQLPKLWDWGSAAQFSCFLGKMMWAEWENGSESAPHHRALALTSVTWRFKITYLAQRKLGYAQTKWCRYLKVQALIVLWKFLLVYILVGGLEDLLSSHWQGNIHKIKKSLLSLACYSFKALLFLWSRHIICWLSYQTLGK